MAEHTTWQGMIHGDPTAHAARWSNLAAAPAVYSPAADEQRRWGPSLLAADEPLHVGATLERAELPLLSPAGERYWTRQGGGRAILAAISLAHVIAGMAGVVVGLLVWWLVMPNALLPLVAGGAALLAGLAGAVSFELARFSPPGVALAARVLLVGADVLACGALLWLIGAGDFVPLLFLVPVVMGALLFPSRGAFAVAVLIPMAFAAICFIRGSFAITGWLPDPLGPAVWLPEAGMLAGLSLLLTACCGHVSHQTVHSFTLAFQRIETLIRQRSALRGEQQRLIEALHLAEDAQARLNQERLLINRQVLDAARVVERLGEGDTTAWRVLHANGYGPVKTLAGALGRMGQHVALLHEQHAHHTTAHQRALESVAGATREQGQLIALTDNALRELGTAANELVAEVQRLERGSGELPGVDRRVLFQALREIERHVLAHASDTAMLGARLAQLRARQSEIEGSMRHLARANAGAFSAEAAMATEAHAPEADPAATTEPVGGTPPTFADVLVGQRLESKWEASGPQPTWML